MKQGVPSTFAAAAGRWPYVSLPLAIFAVALHFWPGAAEHLQLDRAAVLGGEIFRIFTSHFVHFGVDHLMWDTAVFALLGAFCELIDRRKFILTILGSSLLIPLAVLWLQPSISTYRGLSGIDSALFGLLAAELLSENLRRRQRIGAIMIAGLVVAFLMKIGIEMSFGVTVFVDSASSRFIPLPLSHMIGFLVGIAIHHVGAGFLIPSRIHRNSPLICPPSGPIN